MMPPSNFGARASIATAWHWVGSPISCTPLAEQHLQDRAAVIGRAADQEIVGGLAPIFLQPFDVGLEAAGGGDQRRSADFRAPLSCCFSVADRNMPSSISRSITSAS